MKRHTARAILIDLTALTVFGVIALVVATVVMQMEQPSTGVAEQTHEQQESNNEEQAVSIIEQQNKKFAQNGSSILARRDDSARRSIIDTTVPQREVANTQSQLDTVEVDDRTGDSTESSQQSPQLSEQEDSSEPTIGTDESEQQNELVFEQTQPFVDQLAGDTIITENDEFPLREYTLAEAPNDPNYNQWWVNNQNLEAAWDIGPGDYQSTIAIIDTGFDLGHEEFVDRWLDNAGELGEATQENQSDLNCSDRGVPLDQACNNIDDDFDGVVDNESGAVGVENPSRLNCSDQGIALDRSCNLIDDDGNGFVDDWRGWDFAHFDQVVEAGEVDANGGGNFHGTQVAGTAAATGNNGVGIAGVDWNAKILPIQVFDDYSNATTLTVARAIIYAADRDVDVINLSLSSTHPDEYVRFAVQYALDSGSVVVASSGNDSCDCIGYPANYPEVVAVGATTWNNERASFSNWGANLDITAPGIAMSLPTWSPNGDDAYSTSSSGTSFSAPFVSGLLSLAKSHQPDASWDELVSTISATGQRDDATVKNYELGFAIANAADLLQRLTTSQAFTQVYAVRSSETELYLCPGAQGSHTVYRMVQGDGVLFAVNSYELFVLEQEGWQIESELYVCTLLPDDSADSIKIIDPNRELEDQGIKS